jgi:hypothetical protein
MQAVRLLRSQVRADRRRWPARKFVAMVGALTVVAGCAEFDVSAPFGDMETGTSSLSGTPRGADGAPVAERPIPMRELANEVTSLEDEIHRHGSITVKQPDVWGDADLMGYIQEYEQVMINRLTDFKDTIQGYIARSDQSDLQSMTSLGLNLAPGGGAIPTPFSNFTAANGANSAVTPANVTTTATGAAQQGQVFDVLNQALSNPNTAPTAKFSLEPTESLQQNSTYLKVNQGLRRINSGADTAQAAGYGLYLLRVPVSILPGRKTREGYSAVVTMRAQMVIDPDHLRVTFPKLVFGDLADQLLRTYIDHWQEENLPNSAVKSLHKKSSSLRTPRLNAMMRSATLTLADPVTLAQCDDLYGYQEMNFLFKSVKQNMGQSRLKGGLPPRDELRKWLVSYFNRLYDEMKERQLLTGAPYEYIPQAGAAYARGDKATLANLRNGWMRTTGGSSELAGAGWMVIAQSAVLDRQLKDALKDMKRAGHLQMAADDAVIDGAQFASSDPAPQSETQELWSTFVQSQYPMHVFELDPEIEEQNIYNAFSQRRELQLAIAFAVANGSLRADQAMKYTRQMALDMTTIDLNRTQVGFTHENDTFGWYFYPRVQAVDPEHTTFGNCFHTLFCGGITRDDELRQRRLEPGIRECEVLVVMPNFVPELKLDITTNWEKLTRPGKSKLDYNEMIELGAQVECVKHRAMNVCDARCYRPGDYERLVSRIDQLEKMLPLQTFSVTVPYQYDLPGSQLFDRGAASLEPEVTGYYGLSYIKRGSSTVAQFFLTGHHFHPTRTHVIIGGTEVHSSVQVLQFSAAPTSGQVVQTAGQTVQTSGTGKTGGSTTTNGGATGSTGAGNGTGSAGSGSGTGSAGGGSGTGSSGSGTTTSPTGGSGGTDSTTGTSVTPAVYNELDSSEIANSRSRGTVSLASSGESGTGKSGHGGSSGSGHGGSGSGTGSTGGSGSSGGGTESGGSGGSSSGSGSGGTSGGSSGGTGTGTGTSGTGGKDSGGTSGQGTPAPSATQTISAGQVASTTGNTVQWTTQQVEVISRDLLRITVSSISPELSAGPIPVRVATPAGLSNEFYIEPAPADTPSGSPFSLINPIITFPFNINTTKTGVIVNPVSGTGGFELKWTAPTGSTVNDLQVKLSIPSTNASTTVAYKLSDNTGADAIDAWLQNQCAAELNQTVDFASPNAAPSPITVTVTVSAAGKQAGSPLTDITLPAPLQLQPKLIMAAADPTTTLSGTPAPAPAAGTTPATTGSGGTATASGGTGGSPASEAQPGASPITTGPPASTTGGSTSETGTASIQSPGPSTTGGTASSPASEAHPATSLNAGTASTRSSTPTAGSTVPPTATPNLVPPAPAAEPPTAERTTRQPTTEIPASGASTYQLRAAPVPEAPASSAPASTVPDTSVPLPEPVPGPSSP